LHSDPNGHDDPSFGPVWPDQYDRVILSSVDNTMMEAARRADLIAKPTWIMARHQSAARGRQGKPWVNPPGNFSATLVFKPNCTAQEAAKRSFLAANALYEALSLYVEPTKLGLKWPNDVLLDGKKIAGILLESVSIDNKDWLIVGVGLNVDSFPKKVRYPATCLTQSGVQIISAKIALSRFIHHFVGRYDMWIKEGFAPVRLAWCDSGYRFGKQVAMESGDEHIEGIFADINDDGAMVVKTQSGELREIVAGEMSYIMEEG